MMPADCNGDRFVSLTGGLVVPMASLLVAIDLERRGFRLTPCPDGDIEVAPFSRLTDEDKADLKRWKTHIYAVLTYTPPTPAWMQ